jgi:hypothetical protein
MRLQSAVEKGGQATGTRTVHGTLRGNRLLAGHHSYSLQITVRCRVLHLPAPSSDSPFLQPEAMSEPFCQEKYT